MKIPRVDSRAWRILKAFADYKKPMTFDQACAIHGHVGYPSKTLAEYREQVAVGNLVLITDGPRDWYQLSAAVQNYFDGLDVVVKKVAVVTIVQPRTPVPFKSTGQYVLGIQSGRPGALDYQNIPSMMGGERVEYQTSGAPGEGTAK